MIRKIVIQIAFGFLVMLPVAFLFTWSLSWRTWALAGLSALLMPFFTSLSKSNRKED